MSAEESFTETAETLPEMREVMRIREATTSVEQALAIEDKGWVRMGGMHDVIDANQRINNIRLSRIYYTKDPLAKQAIRLWTDYTFGRGIAWGSENEAVSAALSNFWNNPANRSVLSARGQRKSSDKLLSDGEIFFIIFPGPKGASTIRWVDPLEIRDFITDVDDIENVLYYRREWSNTQGSNREMVYLSYDNHVNKLPARDMFGQPIAQADGPAIIYHLAINTLSQRGNPLLLPAMPWIKQYRKFLAARVAIMLAMARFAWKIKADGDATQIAAIQSSLHDEIQEAGATAVENQAANLEPIKQDTGAKGAYDDGRMLKLQISSATGIPEQYFGDISIGNLATAKTVELPMRKMFESYQQIWYDTFMDINNLVLDKAKVSMSAERKIDLDFPPITPIDAETMTNAIKTIIEVMPEFAEISDVKQIALLSLGINNTAEILADMPKESVATLALKLARVLKNLKGELDLHENG